MSPSPSERLTPQELLGRSRARTAQAARAADRIRAFLRLQNGVTGAEARPAPAGDRILATAWVEDTPYGLPRRTLPDGTTVTELNPYETDYLYTEIFEERVYAPAGLRMSERPVIVDVGANIGICSLFMARTHPAATVYAFEPSPDAFTALAANTADLGLPVVCLPWAVGGAGGTATMTVYPGATVYSGLHADGAEDRAAIGAAIDAAVEAKGTAGAEVVGELAEARMRGARPARVAVIGLPEVLAGLGGAGVDLLKLDAEGAEAEILGSLGPAQWERIRQIVMEVHHAADLPGLLALLAEAGYATTVAEVPALRGTGYTNVFAAREDFVPGQGRGAGSTSLRSAPPDGPYERLRQALDDFLGGTDLPDLPGLPVDLEVHRRPPRPAATAPTTPTSPEGADPEALSAVLAIWSELLERPVAPADNFFDLGGSSLIAVRMLARLRERLGGRVGLTELMENPTPGGLAARITPGKGPAR